MICPQRLVGQCPLGTRVSAPAREAVARVRASDRTCNRGMCSVSPCPTASEAGRCSAHAQQAGTTHTNNLLTQHPRRKKPGSFSCPRTAPALLRRYPNSLVSRPRMAYYTLVIAIEVLAEQAMIDCSETIGPSRKCTLRKVFQRVPFKEQGRSPGA